MPVAPDLTGSALDGRYELLGLIGEGTFGRVYRGRDRRLRRDVAVKVIKPWWTEDPAWVGRFEGETQMLARVSDPGIVQIFDVGHAEEGLYYVSELVDGESLASRLERGALAPWHACGIAEQLCRALAHAHAQRIIHRDVKPANILISNAGRVKVGDFGVARLAEGSTDGPSATIVGTPRYMAPEQARGRPTSPATDVYSVGVVLYEMLSGDPPFTERSAVELAMRHVQDPPPALPEDSPRALEEIVARALAKDPAERYATAGAMAVALAHARRAASARPANQIARTRGRASTHELAAVGAPAASRERQSSGTDAPTRRTSRSRRPRRPDSGHPPPRGADPTRVAPRMSARRNVNPSARRRSAAALTLACLLVLAMAATALVLGAAKQVRVPRLTHLSKPAIASTLRHVGLTVLYTSRYAPEPKGTAVAQVPAARQRVPAGSKVRVVLSAGLAPVAVPQVVGQASQPARAALQSRGLRTDLSQVPAPGVRPGTVTKQAPAAGASAPAHSTIALSVAEYPQWRSLTRVAGSSAQTSVPFHIRGTHFRVVYSMGYQGACTLLLFCSGPSAEVANLSNGTTAAGFGLGDGSDQTRVVRSGPGLYQIKIAPGSDTARWSIEVQDYF